MNCEIIEASVEDATGYPCGRDASAKCCDCGADLCDAHEEACNVCSDTFCPTCLAFHAKSSHQKRPALPNREFKKSA
jgi:hypothetical protein